MSAPSQLTSSVFRHRSFRQYWIARLTSVFAYQMQTVAVGWQMYALTGSALDLGLVGLAQFLPSIALLLVVGHVADRHDRRRILTWCQRTEAAAAITLAALSITGAITREAIFAMVVVIGAARAFEMPTQQTLLPATVPFELLSRAVAANASAGQTAIVLGPALGGLLYVAGPTTVYGICALMFLAASMLVRRIHLERAPPQREPATLASLFAGIAYIRRQRALLGAISLDLFAVLLGGAAALMPIYARDILFTGPWGLGLLRSAPAVGALTTAFWLAHHPLQRHAGRTMLIAVALFGVGTIAFGLSRSFALSLGTLALMGAADMFSVVVRQSLVQLGTPDAMRGRVSAVNSMFIGASNQLGEFESGVTAAWFGTVPAVVLGGVGTLMVVVLWWKLFPQLAAVDELVPLEQERR
ncbi:MAG TPA: MFS transporter [Casimicrobiaceae bacterium]|nr:MFS transporter [Casimicrobiaceae bacterium]